MTIYQKLKRIARPILKAYHDDLAKHDLKCCRAMKDGERALWCVRTYGTHWIWLAKNDDAITTDCLEGYRNALNWFDAVAAVFGNEDGAKQWYLIEKIGDAVMPVSADEARQLFLRRIQGFQSALKRAA